MPSLLSLPREIRVDIYGWVLRAELVSKPSKRPRARVAKRPPRDHRAETMLRDVEEAAEASTASQKQDTTMMKSVGAGYYEGEESVRYPSSKPVPPAEGLMRANRQLRDEMLETVAKTFIRYKIQLVFRDDQNILYPTWISMPCITNQIDVLDVDLRVRQGRTRSSFGALSSGYLSPTSSECETEGDYFVSGLIILKRFLERGPSFISKKVLPSQKPSTTIKVLALRVEPKEIDSSLSSQEVFDEMVEMIEVVLCGKEDDYAMDEQPEDDKWINNYFRFFAGRIVKLVMQVEETRHEWNIGDCVAERDEKMRNRRKRGCDGNRGADLCTNNTNNTWRTHCLI